jgi:hypothetical protein
MKPSFLGLKRPLGCARLGELDRRHPDRITHAIRRTLERRIWTWKALHGPDREVMFSQTHNPGRMGLSDFTDMAELGMRISGTPLASNGEVVLGGESYTALATGLSRALTILGGLGGAPHEYRSDSLSAAFHNLCANDAEDLTRRFAALTAHYDMVPTRNNRGVAHENGSIESRHGHVKSRIEQALLLRGSSDFERLDDYRTFVGRVIADHNKRHADAIKVEQAYLRPLPPAQPVTWQEANVRVTSSSGFSFRHAIYTVRRAILGIACICGFMTNALKGSWGRPYVSRERPRTPAVPAEAVEMAIPRSERCGTSGNVRALGAWIDLL